MENSTEPCFVNAKTIDGFTQGMLAAKYDNPKPIPDFHWEMWELCCSEHQKVAIAAPRGHAKSTAITHAFILAMMLFRIKRFCLLVSDTESQAAGFLVDIKAELESNEALRKTFNIRKLLKDTETNIICQMKDGHKFRIQAKGSEQKVRGIKWMNMRPDLIVGDDLENDEIVMNPDRREKFRKWLMNALIPCGSDTVWIRLVGTILHLDSALQRLIEDKTWKHLFYEAEDGNFENVLWPEKFSAETLRNIYESYLEQGNPEGYAQEYRNQPVAIENAFFNPDYFYDFERDDDGNWQKPNLEYFAAADFAISEKEKADFTVIIVGGMSPDGILHIVDVKRFKGDSEMIIAELIATQKHHKPNLFTFETAKIDKAIGPFLEREQLRQKTYLNILKVTPTQSKTMRARSIQAMHKAGAVKYDKQATWYPAFESELLMVADSGPRGRHDDMFDAFAYLGLTIDQHYEAQSDEEIEDEEYEQVFEDYHDQGRDHHTGY
jgi:predicted phage terminase large subunit-like protein